MKQVKVKNKIIADSLPASIVAEMAWSHDGSMEKAEKILRAASDAEADPQSSTLPLSKTTA